MKKKEFKKGGVCQQRLMLNKQTKSLYNDQHQGCVCDTEFLVARLATGRTRRRKRAKGLVIMIMLGGHKVGSRRPINIDYCFKFSMLIVEISQLIFHKGLNQLDFFYNVMEISENPNILLRI